MGRNQDRDVRCPGCRKRGKRVLCVKPSDEIAKLRHRRLEARAQARRHATRLASVRRADRGGECTRSSGDQRVHANPVTLVTPIPHIRGVTSCS